MGKVYNAITLDDVNQKLLKKLAFAIDDADPSDVVLLGKLTDHVSKLNASFRNNAQFGVPESEDEKLKRQQAEIFSEALGGKG